MSRAPLRRPSHRARLVKMSNSERAKLYRQQHNERTRLLAASVTRLRSDVHQLALHAQLLRGLFDCEVDGSSRVRILTFMHAVFVTPRLHVPGFTVEASTLRRVTAHGTDGTVIVELVFELHGTYSSASLETVYCSIPGNSVLLGTLMHSRVRYSGVARLFFSREGVCESHAVEVDWLVGLTECLGDMSDVAKVVGPFQRLGSPAIDFP